MTYVAAVIGSNPQNYWRLNEGPGALACMDYGNQPGDLYPDPPVVNGIAATPSSGAGYRGITADGGARDMSQVRLASRVPPPSTVLNPYVPLPDPGTLELWTFIDAPTKAVYVGWFAPNVGTGGQALHGMVIDHLSITAWWVTGGSSVGTTLPSQWNHIAMVWNQGAGFLYVNGTQQLPLAGPANIGGGRVHFFIGDNQSAATNNLVGGFVTEVATYRRALTVGDLDTHFDQAELKGTRPNWLGVRQAVSNAPVTINHAYTIGVKHVARTGEGSFQVPTGLRGFQIDIIPPFPSGRVSPGQPPYLWDVGWVSVLDPNGMLAEIRPNRDTRVWQPGNVELATVFTHNLNPGWTIDVTELDPA